MKTDLSFEKLHSYDIPSYDDDYCIDEEEEKESDIEFYSSKIGPAPLDYLVIAQTSVVRPPMVKPVYVLCWCHPEELAYYVSDYPVLKDGMLLPQEERKYPRESYDKIEDAGRSDYFKYLYRVDKATDKKIEEIKRHELDTKYAPHGLRIGASWGKTFTLYGEEYNKLHPEHHEYVQVKSENGQYRYTASHMSFARKYELGDVYNAYFDDPPREDYFIRISSINELDQKYSYFALPFKLLQHRMMNEMLEVGMALYETRGKKLPYDPIITSIRGAIGKNTDGQLAEATVDINQFQRIYIIAVTADGQENLMVTSRSLYLESMPNMYHAFDFDWSSVILREFVSRDDAQNDPVYGTIYAALFRLMAGLEKTKKPYVWRNGCDDPYGFATVKLAEGIGAEQRNDPLSGKKPSNLNVMMQPHPSL